VHMGDLDGIVRLSRRCYCVFNRKEFRPGLLSSIVLDGVVVGGREVASGGRKKDAPTSRSDSLVGVRGGGDG
jgi:hypothetical protein